MPETSTSTGSTRESRSRVATLSTSLSMLRAMPGYWILSARSRPSAALARCTCPIDAAATGSKSNDAKRSSQPFPYSRPSTRRSCAAGMVSASARSTARACGELGGQDVGALEGEELAELHRGAAELGEAAGQTLGVRRGEEGACHASRRLRRCGAARAERAARALGETSGGELAGQEPEAREPLEAARRHARRAPAPPRRHADRDARGRPEPRRVAGPKTSTGGV